MPARRTLMPSPWSEESCSSSGRATFGGSGTASWRAATRRWRPVTGEGFPATSTPHLKTRQETFGSFRVSRRVQAGVVQVGDSRDEWCTVGQVRTGVMDNEITVVKLLECCLTHCSVHWAGVHKHQLFSPECLKYLMSLSGSGGDAPFDAFDLLLSNLMPSKRLEEGSQTLQGFISCHLHCSTNWSFKLNMTQKETGRGLNLTARKCIIGHSSDVWAMFALLVWSCWGRHGIWITVTSGWAYGWYVWCTTSCVHSIGF